MYINTYIVQYLYTCNIYICVFYTHVCYIDIRMYVYVIYKDITGSNRSYTRKGSLGQQ